MLKSISAALALALLVAACGSGSHTSSSSSTAPAASSSSATSTSTSTAAHSTTSAQARSTTSTKARRTTTTSSSAPSSSTTTTSSSSSHTHTQPPDSTPHFLVKLKLGPGPTVTPPGVAIGGHTIVDLSVANDSGATVKLAIAHGSKTQFSRSLPSGTTAVQLPALANATYELVLNGKPRGTLTIGASAGP